MIKKQIVPEKPSNIGKTSLDYFKDEGNFILNLNSTEGYQSSLDDQSDLYTGLINTQQIEIDWSKFENHTFFNSARVKVDIAFDKIINEYPFDGTEKNILTFIESLTGFEKWVFDQFPRSASSIHFKNNYPSTNHGTYIEVFEPAGSVFSDLTTRNNIENKLNFISSSFSIQMNLFIPENINSNQVLFQKQNVFDGNSKGFAAFLSGTTNLTTAKINFLVGSGSLLSEVNCLVEKGKFNNLTFVCDRTKNFISIYKNGIESSRSQNLNLFNDLSCNKNLLIGSGTNWYVNNTEYFSSNSLFSGSMDEFRCFNKVLSTDFILNFYQKLIFAQDNLLVYYRFNEPSSKISNDIKKNAIVLDYSGNSLHTFIQDNNNGNYYALNSGSIRQFTDSTNLVDSQIYYFSPILFTGHQDVIDLNQNLHLSSSFYDEENPNLITKLIPKHYLNSDLIQSTDNINSQQKNSVQILLTFLYSYAKFFDELKIYLDSFSRLRSINYDSNLSVPDNFTSNLFKYFGFEEPNIFQSNSLELNQNNGILNEFIRLKTFNKVKNDILKRILVSIPEVIKTKGSHRSLEIFLRSLGVEPNNNFMIKEYGNSYIHNLNTLRDKKSIVFKSIYLDSLQNLRSPYLTGSYLNYDNTTNFYTAGSWSFECLYKLNDYTKDNSLVKFFITSGSQKSLIFNVVSTKNSLNFYINADKNNILSASINLNDINLYDQNRFHLCIGKNKDKEKYFLSVIKSSNGEVLDKRYDEISFSETTSLLNSPLYKQIVGSNIDGVHFEIGNSNSILNQSNFLNSGDDYQKLNYFEGNVSQIRFWTTALSQNEIKEHALNYNSIGVDDVLNVLTFNQPKKNGYIPGSYERLLLNCSCDQGETTPVNNTINVFDYTKNDFHMSGTFYSDPFVSNKEIITKISQNFDSSNTKERIRIRSFTNIENIDEYSRIAPVNILQSNDNFNDNSKLAIEYSLVDYLNSDIMNIFSTLDEFQNKIGTPENLYSYEYSNFESYRNIYFSKLNDKINFKSFYEVFKWFDSTIENFIKQIIPRKTSFYGVNYVIQQHNLERSKYEHKNISQYTGETDYSNHIDPIRIIPK